MRLTPTAVIRRVAKGVRNYYEAARIWWQPDRSWIPGGLERPTTRLTPSDRRELMRQAQYWEHNDALPQRLADLFESYTVGSGIPCIPASNDVQWNLRAKSWWDEWCKYPDLCSRQNLTTLLSGASRRWFIDGESFFKLTSGSLRQRMPGGAFPRLQWIDSVNVETPPDKGKEEGLSIIDGVQVDEVGRPSGYHVATEKEGKISYEQVAADLMVHIFEPHFAGQKRGVTFFHAVLNELHDLIDLETYEQKAAKDAAIISNVITNQAGELDPGELRRLKYQTSSSSQNTEGNSPVEERSRYFKDRFGATTEVLRAGEKLEQFRSDRPSVTTRDYWKWKAEKVCAGVGIPYVLAFPDMMQGTVYRGALDMANVYFAMRHQVVADAVRRIWEYVMGWAILNVPTLRDPPADWKNVAIHPPRSVNVDVGYNAQAIATAMENGFTNYELVFSPLGLDWREQLRKRAEQAAYVQKLADEFGLDPAQIAGTASGHSEPDGDEEQEAEEEGDEEEKKA
jgi:lambda family phage portal protein